MTKLLLFICFLISGFSQILAQEPSLSGTIKSKADSTALPGATLILENSSSAEKKYQITDKDGNFSFQAEQKGDYKLEIRYLGFKTISLGLELKKEKLSLGNIYLEEDSIALNEVQVIGRVPMAEQKGDTIQFNAAAFTVNPDASAEDLVLKMPGITVIDGKIQAQGEEVLQILVDGKRFFDGDPNTALRNLPAEIIDNIQVFDKKSDQAEFSGYDDGNRQKTINIVTKENRRTGFFGKTAAAYGTDNRYLLGASVNAFREERRITFTGVSNNINMQDFSIGETPGGGMRGRRGRFGESGGAVASLNGNVRTNNLGLNYNDEWGEKMEVSGNYAFNRQESLQAHSTLREFIAPQDSGQVYLEENISSDLNQGHRINMRLEYNINDRNRLLITPNINIQYSEDDAYRIGRTDNQNRALNRTENTSASNSTSLNFGNNIHYSHRFNKRGRTFSTRLSTAYNTNDGETFRVQDNWYYTRKNTHELVNQYVNHQKGGYNWQAGLSYSEPIGDSSRVQLEYNIGNRFNDSDKRTFDMEENGSISNLDTLLSNTFQSEYLTQGYEAGYQYNINKLRLQFGVEYQVAELLNDQIFPYAYELQRTFNSMLPELQFEYRFSRSKNLRFDYSTSTNAPSVEQLQEVIDNSNPLQLSTGNPDLEQTFQNRVNLRFQNFNRETHRVFFLNLSGSLTENSITNVTIRPDSTIRLTDDIVLERGSQLTKPVNLNGEWNIRSNINWGRPVESIRSNINLSGSVAYSRRPGMINDVINYTNSTSFNFRLGLSSNISEKLDFNISSGSNYNLVDNTILPQSNNNYFNQSTQVRVNWIFWKGLVYRTEFNQQLNAGLSTGFNTNYLLWNMSLSKKIFKNQRGELSLSVNDLLEQNIGIRRNVTDSYIEDTRSSVLQRYFMLTFSYSIRHFPGGEPERPGRGFRGGRGGRFRD